MSVVPGIVLGGAAVPTDSADTYPVTDPQWGLGGARTVVSTTDRNAIPIPRLQKGMLVHCTADGKTYQLNDTWTGGVPVDADWTVAIPNGGSLTGSGIAESVPYWVTPTSLAADIFFKNPFDTEILQTHFGYQIYQYDVVITRYIDPAGSDSNDGLSSLTPWKTPNYANDQCPTTLSGAYRIVCAPGTYTGVSLTVRNLLGRDYTTDTAQSLIEFVGDETTPSNVGFSGTSSLINQFSNTTAIRLAGIRLTGNGSNTGIFQQAGSVYIRNCEGDSFRTFCRASSQSKIFTEGSNTLTITNTYVGFSAADGVSIYPNCSINLSAPDNSSPCVLFDMLASRLLCSSGLTLRANSAHVGLTPGVGYLISAINSYIDLFIFNTFETHDCSGSFYLDGLSYLNVGNACTINNYVGEGMLFIGGGSVFTDSSSTTWFVDSLTPNGIQVKSGAIFQSSCLLHVGLFITQEIVTYIQYQPNDNYTVYALDNRYIDTYGFTVLGHLPQGYSTTDIGPSGILTTAQPFYISKGKEEIISLTVYNRVPNGVLLPDTYFIYINGVASSLSVNLTTGNSNTATGSVSLASGDRVSLVFSSNIFTAAEDITVEIAVRKVAI